MEWQNKLLKGTWELGRYWYVLYFDEYISSKMSNLGGFRRNYSFDKKTTPLPKHQIYWNLFLFQPCFPSLKLFNKKRWEQHYNKIKLQTYINDLTLELKKQNKKHNFNFFWKYLRNSICIFYVSYKIQKDKIIYRIMANFITSIKN